MLFHYVDRIYKIKSGQYAVGLKNVTRYEHFFYWLPTGQRVLSPAVVTEALAQLGAWLKMYTADFTKRPVLLADELTSYHGWVTSGDQLELYVKILDLNDDVVVTQSVAYCGHQPILATRCCRGYMLPLEEFSHRDDVVAQFRSLYKPLNKQSVLSKTSYTPEAKIKLPAVAGKHIWQSLQFLDGLLEHKPYERVVAFKNFSSCESYFASHFPLKPVAPGVLLMTFMGEACQYLIKETIQSPVRSRALIPTFTRKARFRKFVEPGDQCILEVDIIEGNPHEDGEDIVVKAVMRANNNRVLQAEMGFRVMLGPKSIALEKPMPIEFPDNLPPELQLINDES